jgi:hypothetical protein
MLYLVTQKELQIEGCFFWGGGEGWSYSILKVV